MNRRILRWTLLAGSASLALGGAAQAGEPSADRTSASSVAEVIVTARKREESLQDVPLAVTAVGAADLATAGAMNVKDLSKLSPGLFYQSFDAVHPNLLIRGVGSRQFDAGSEASIGTFVDGVYVARFGSTMQDMPDVERVEVLRGPQGALFGRNTIGGAINVVTSKPTDTFQAEGSVTYGRSESEAEEMDGSVLLSGPIYEDKLLGQISLSRTSFEGDTFVDNTKQRGNGAGTAMARGRLVFRPTSSLELDLIADTFRSVDDTLFFSGNTVGGLRPRFPLAATQPTYGPNPYHTNADPGVGGLKRHGWGVNGTINWETEFADVTSITAYRHSGLEQSIDYDSTTLQILSGPTIEKANQFSQELRMASRDGGPFTFNDRVDWLFGVYYFEESVDRDDPALLGKDSIAQLFFGRTGFENRFASVDTESWAAFAQVGLAVTDKLKVDVGIRYTNDEKDALLGVSSNLPAFFGPNFVQPLSRSWSSTDPSVSIAYRVTPEAMLFASYAHGYKSGAFQFIAGSQAVAQRVAAPEKVDAYQAGVRSDWLEGRLRVNVSGFYYDYKNIQVPRVDIVNNLPVVLLTNAGVSTIKGIEFEGAWRLTDEFRLEYNYAYLDATYDEYIFSPTVSFTGNRLPRSPKNAFNIALNYEKPLSWGELLARVNVNYMDDFFFEPDNAELNPGTKESQRTLVDARIGFRRGPLTATLWARNLGDEKFRASVLNISGFPLLEVWAPRRRVGVTFAAEF